MLDMILGHDPRGLSTGEVYALFRPGKPGHYRLGECGCAANPCPFWEDVLGNADEDHYFQYLFDKYSSLDFVVDSSKQLWWIKKQTALLRAKNIRSETVLIWKNPLLSYNSFKKRNKEAIWATQWVRYHARVMALFPRCRTINYIDLVQSRTALQTLCRDIGISYFTDKHAYWHSQPHTIFGNPTAKVHLHEHKSIGYRQLASWIQQGPEDEQKHLQAHHQKLWSDPDITDETRREYQALTRTFPQIEQIEKLLHARPSVFRRLRSWLILRYSRAKF